MSTLVELVPYDPNRIHDFSGAEARLRSSLGACVLAIDHVGSTSIPGICAKPIIDIDVTVSGLTDIPVASVNLVDVGFEPRGNRYDDDVWAFLYRTPTPQIRAYLSPPGNRTHFRRLLFRDYLRRNDEAAAAYSTLKQELARRFPYDGDSYTLEKSEFVSEIVGRAESDAP
jgi:GrpB-like predicted nucleotidyltransferase (UPF0157 family)